MRLTNNFLIRLACITWFCLAQLLVSIQSAAQGIDIEPPVIEHEVIESAAAADRQSFLATIADDDELASVRFLYRFEGEQSYTSVDMNRVSFSSTFTVQVPTKVDDGRAIEYYIEARDVSGNRTLRGYAFSPLVRLVELPAPVAVAAPVEEPIATSNKRGIYYLLGALVVGALVGGLVQANSGDGPTGPGCPDLQCPIVVTANPPGG